MRRVIASNPRQAGLSLIELMIAMLVGLILIAGVLSIFMSSRKSYGINSAVGQIQEHGRFALDFIRHDTRMAGYMGCGVSGVNFDDQLNASASLPYDFNNSLTGYESNNTAPTNTYVIGAENPAPAAATNWTPSLDASLPVAAGTPYAIAGSDVLAMTMTQNTTNPTYITNIPSPTAANFDVNAPGLAAGDIMVISNCVSTMVLQVTGVGGGGTVILHSTAPMTPGNNTAGVPQSFQDAQIGTGTAVAFYVGESTDGSPALFQATTNTAFASGFLLQELVPGVENMQVLYGVDTTGSGNASEYDTANVVAANNFANQVVSVRVALLLRSDIGAVTLPPAAVTYNLLGTVIQAPLDTRLRQVFTTTIGVRNHMPNP